jgi:hypothetical protein
VSAPQGRGVLGGLALTVVLHVLVSILVAFAGLAYWGRGGGFGVLVFWATLGLTQWPYMAPAALFARRSGRPGVAKGLWIGGALGTLLTALCWGEMGVSKLTWAR